MTPFKLPEMKESEIVKLIREQLICRIAFRGDKSPYIAPFQYAFMDDHLYFHFTNYGRKMKLFAQDEPVCVEIERTTPDMREYAFVAMVGKLKLVTDPGERARAIEKLSREGRERFSKNFLASHGLTAEDGWLSLSPEKPLVIIKLERVLECIGLKSPS
jgi:hypothetical protein